MALYDNKHWLLSHIRNSFISTDDTGMCELVMSGQTKEVEKHLLSLDSYPDPDESEDDEEDFGSYEFPMENDFSIRERSNTAAQLEKMEQARKRAPKIRHVKWELNKNEVDVDDLFEKKEVPKAVAQPKKSLLSTLLESVSNLPKNPYMEYAKFDGSGQINIPIRKYKIYLTMLPTQQRNYPLHVCCIASAKIQDLIGLILLKQSTSGGPPISLKPIQNYGLYITEDDGEVDGDFPCLDPNEVISKFGFKTLGLVEHKEGSRTVSFPEESKVLFSLDSSRKRTTSEKSKAEENRQIQNLLVMEEHTKKMEAPLYQSFCVFLLNKVRPKVKVFLGISGERIEVDAVQKNSKLIPFKQKSISHPMDMLASCDITDTKNNRSAFRVVYNTGFSSYGDASSSRQTTSYSPTMEASPSFKHYDFECESATAQDIVHKISLILELRSSTSRNLYNSKDKRGYKKRL